MLRIYDFQGTPRAMGEAFGESCRQEIQELYRRRLDNAIAQAKEYGGRRVDEAVVLNTARRCLPATEGYDPSGYSELVGIARASHLSIERLFAMNGLTDLRDTLAWSKDIEAFGGCSSFMVQGDLTGDGAPLAGQSWDLATDNMPFVIGVRRRPSEGPRTWSLTTAGCLSLIGMNEEGIAVGTTNLRTTDARFGVMYLSIIHKALGQRGFEDAVRAVTSAERAGAHYYYVVDRTGRAAAVECTALAHERTDVTAGAFVHCNHVKVPRFEPLQASVPLESSTCRDLRLGALIAASRSKGERLDDSTMRRFLGDHDNGVNAICRHDIAGVSSNGAAVMSPAAPRFWAAQGHPCTAEWVDLLS